MQVLCIMSQKTLPDAFFLYKRRRKGSSESSSVRQNPVSPVTKVLLWHSRVYNSVFACPLVRFAALKRGFLPKPGRKSFHGNSATFNNTRARVFAMRSGTRENELQRKKQRQKISLINKCADTRNLNFKSAIVE